MKQGNLRKRLSVMGLAIVISAFAMTIILEDRTLDWPPGPTVAGIKVPDAPSSGFEPNLTGIRVPGSPDRTLAGIKVPQHGGSDIIAV